MGCCTLAPVVQIDGKTYGHVKTTQVDDIIYDFLHQGKMSVMIQEQDGNKEVDAEIRVGIGSCCVAGGSKEILSEIFEIKQRYNLNIRLKQVGCVGVCNQTPLMEIVTKDEVHSRYTKVSKARVEEILLKHVQPRELNKRIRYKINDLVDTFLSEDKLTGQVNLPVEQREKYLNNFLNHQVHLATKNNGMLSPESYDEYCLSGGYEALKKCLKESDRGSIIKIISESGLTGSRRCRFSDR